MGNAPQNRMRRISLLLLCLAPWLAPLQGATLERLSLDDVIQKSSDIVRARVLGSRADFRGSMIYTHWSLQVSERLKGADQSTIEVLVPGGSASGFRQEVPGAPRLVPGREYLLFLWTSKTGSLYITGWGQGVFNLSKNAGGDLMAGRAATDETMLDPATWLPVQDEAILMRYSEMFARISTTLARGAVRQ